MKRKVVRLLSLLAAVGTIALWPAANSGAWEACPTQSCDFWQGICQMGGGDWDVTDTGICIMENNSPSESFHAVCTPPNPAQAPWSMDCTPG
jgi:hypothetical protein